MLVRHRSDTNAVFVGEPCAGDLERICDVLNSSAYPNRQRELRQFVQRWRVSGPNLEKMLDEDEALADELQNSWFGKYISGAHGRAHILLRPKKLKHNDHEYAVGMFAALTLHPECERLQGPCAYRRCGKYYLQKTRRKTDFCSRPCQQKAGGLRHRQAQLTELRNEKLRKAEVAIRQWRTSRKRLDWMTWVCRHIPEITRTFLTRAVNKGDLIPPTDNRIR
jgi:hypothetical protein